MNFLRPKETSKKDAIEQSNASTSSSAETAKQRGERSVNIAKESARIDKEREEQRKQEIREGKIPEDVKDADKRTRSDVSSGDEDSKKRAEKRKNNPIRSTLEENI